MLDVLDKYPEALTGLIVFQIDVDGEPRFFIATSEELLREHAEKVGGTVKARRSPEWTITHEFGSRAEIIAARWGGSGNRLTALDGRIHHEPAE